MRTTNIFKLAALALAVSLASACDLQGPIDQQSAEALKAQEHNQLRDAINQPIDKAKNASGERRRLASSDTPRDEIPSGDMAPHLKQLMAEYALTGLPPAYVPLTNTVCPTPEEAK